MHNGKAIDVGVSNDAWLGYSGIEVHVGRTEWRGDSGSTSVCCLGGNSLRWHTEVEPRVELLGVVTIGDLVWADLFDHLRGDIALNDRVDLGAGIDLMGDLANGSDLFGVN